MRYILPAALAAKCGLNTLAYRRYVRMLDELLRSHACELEERVSSTRLTKNGRGRLPRPFLRPQGLADLLLEAERVAGRRPRSGIARRVAR